MIIVIWINLGVVKYLQKFKKLAVLKYLFKNSSIYISRLREILKNSRLIFHIFSYVVLF